MLSSILSFFNLPDTFSISFDELGIFKALSHASIYKRNGTETRTIFTIIFSMIFQNRSWREPDCKVKMEGFPSRQGLHLPLPQQCQVPIENYKLLGIIKDVKELAVNGCSKISNS